FPDRCLCRTACACRSVPAQAHKMEELYAGEIEETADGRGRGTRGQTRRTLESQPQGRLARNGRLDERAATARVREHQAQGPSAQEERVRPPPRDPQGFPAAATRLRE